MSARARLTAALDAARAWHGRVPQARDFCAWPDDLNWAARAAHRLPSSSLVLSTPGAPGAGSAALVKALQDIVGDVEWRHTYTAEEVGQHFLDHFCWFELAGPEGHFITHQARITVGYWGPGLFYPRHQHAAEELYTVLSGRALFHADGEADAWLAPGGTRLHLANQPHAMTTGEDPVLTLVFWRGTGLADPPRMTIGAR